MTSRFPLARVLAVLLALTLALPVPGVLAAGGSLGTARGVRGAELSLDGGARWLALGAHALPLVPGGQVRTTSGGVLVELAGGGRLDLLPFSAAAVSERAGRVVVRLAYGRLRFRLPGQTRVVLETPAARVVPAGGPAYAGDLVAAEATGVRVREGRLEVSGADGGPVQVAGVGETVFLPEAPARPEQLFAAVEAAAPAGARAVYSPRGESLGYVRPDGRLVVQPGYTADLTRPFAPAVVATARAGLPAGAMPLFDVHGAYVGHVAGPTFYYAQAAPGRSGAEGYGFTDTLDDGSNFWLYAGGAVLAVGAGVGIAAAAGAFESDDDEPATPVSP